MTKWLLLAVVCACALLAAAASPAPARDRAEHSNTPYPAVKIAERYAGTDQFKLITRTPQPGGGFTLGDAVVTESQLRDTSRYQRAAPEIPWCSRCGGSGRRIKTLYPERTAGYFHRPGDQVNQVFKTKEEQEWEDRQCPQRRGSGLSQ